MPLLLGSCGMYTHVDILHGGGRAALRGKAENATVTGWGVDHPKFIPCQASNLFFSDGDLDETEIGGSLG